MSGRQEEGQRSRKSTSKVVPNDSVRAGPHIVKSKKTTGRPVAPAARSTITVQNPRATEEVDDLSDASEEDIPARTMPQNVADPTLRPTKRVASPNHTLPEEHVQKKTALGGARKTLSVDAGADSEEISSSSEIAPRGQRNPEVRWVGPSRDRSSLSSLATPQTLTAGFGDGARFRDSGTSTPRRSVQFADLPPPMSGTYQQQSQRDRNRQSLGSSFTNPYVSRQSAPVPSSSKIPSGIDHTPRMLPTREHVPVPASRYPPPTLQVPTPTPLARHHPLPKQAREPRLSAAEIVNHKATTSARPVWQTVQERLDRDREEKAPYDVNKGTDREWRRHTRMVVGGGVHGRALGARKTMSDVSEIREEDRAVVSPDRHVVRLVDLDNPNRRAVVDDDDDSMYGDEPVDIQAEEPREMMAARKTAESTALKAARKTRSTPVSDDDESDEILEVSDGTPTPPPSDESEEEDDDSDGIVILDGPPLVTIPLPQLVKKEEPVETLAMGPKPPPELLHAISNPLLEIVPSIRQGKTRRLPFLRRSVRVGFKHRCDLRGISTRIDRAGVRNIQLETSYKSAGSAGWKETKDGWSCPFCDLFGQFATKEMFEAHLKWDHSKIYYEWGHIEAGMNSVLYKLITVIQEPVPAAEGQLELPIVIKTEDEADGNLFPFVTLSPSRSRQSTVVRQTPAPRLSSATPSNTRSSSIYATDDDEMEMQPQPHRQDSITSVNTLSTNLETDTESRISGLGTPTSTRPRRRRATDDVSLTLTESVPVRCITPPPRSNLLGPACLPLKLPLLSDYGGPNVYYSTRPGGPYLFDWLSTLPMEDFGVLSWEVLDREDEIWESEDVREEFKIMHALWARWIFLNRRHFIGDHVKGTTKFIDDYWKIIHRAAGWEALRFWLLMLLANRYLTASDVAKLLKHYEGLTMMENWYT